MQSVDWQQLFNIAVLLVGALSGWLFRIMWVAQRDLRIDLREIEQSMPRYYVRRDDFKDSIAALFTKLDRIEDKLDNKVDKP